VIENKEDLTGRKFGYLTVTKRIGRNKWECVCKCGNTCVEPANRILSGHKTSCGCKLHDKPYNYLGRDKNKRLYIIWKSMRLRCNNPKSNHYDRYGGRGITICDEWSDYSVFERWALENGYNDKLTIDRIDFDGNYEPSNCRWITQKQQTNNTSVNVYLEYKGETKTRAEWAELYGIPYFTLRKRLERNWDIEKALTTPVRKMRRKGYVEQAV
jgi:hypothetical protein